MSKILTFRPRPTLAGDVAPRIAFPGRVARFPQPRRDRLAAALRWADGFVANGYRPPVKW